MDLRDQVSAIETLPLVPLRDNVVFPHQLAPLGAGRARSVAALIGTDRHKFRKGENVPF